MKHGAGLNAVFRICHADPDHILSRLNNAGIELLNIQIVDSITTIFSVRSSYYRETVDLLQNWHVEYSMENAYEQALIQRSILTRPVIKIAIIFLLITALYLPGRILFVYVSGNSSVPTRKIAEIAASQNVCFGSRSSELRSEKVKNSLLEEIPELQWVGVRTNGCVATIYVTEKDEYSSLNVNTAPITSIYATVSGVVDSCTATSGTILCKPGQAVTAGETLISGYVDCGILIKTTRAKGEIYAHTIRNVSAVAPRNSLIRHAPTRTGVHYSIRLGKKLINLNNNSGIYPGTCAKIYEEQYMVLPGGFALPISIIKETVCFYDNAEDEFIAMVSEEALKQYCEQQTVSTMVAGQIYNKRLSVNTADDVIIINGQYFCQEMIGRERIEQIIQGD